jgi:uncharacterized membrane protein YcaP (DUF421 family)
MDIVLRATVAFLFILFLTRIVGRRELNTLEPFDLILLVTIGDLIQQGVTQNDFSVTGMMLAAGTIGALTVLFSYLPWRFQRLRPVLEGEPVILIEDGNVIEKNLRRNRLTQEEVAVEARSQQIASFDEVRWAVLETNGQINFIKKSGN